MYKRIQTVCGKLLPVVVSIIVLCVLFVPESQARPLLRGDFTQINENGFGDPNNSYAWSMAWFRGRLYVGTARNLFEARAFAHMAPPLDPYPVPMPGNFCDLDVEAEIWEYTPGTGIWKRVYRSPDSLTLPFDAVAPLDLKCPDGTVIPADTLMPAGTVIDSARDSGYRGMLVHDDPVHGEALYVCGITYLSVLGFPARILRGTIDNTGKIEFQPLQIEFPPGSELPQGVYIGSFRSIVAFKGNLYVAPVGPVATDPEVRAVYEMEIRHEDHWAATLRRASETGFGDETNLCVFKMAVFNDYLYAGIGNRDKGYQVWKTDATGDLPYSWTPVLMDGAYRGPPNQGTLSMHVFEGKLYVGGGISMGFDFVSLLWANPELIRINPDDSWQIICGERRNTPDGLKIPLSGMGPGFDNGFTGYFWRMQEHDDWLYLGTYDTSSPFLPYIPFDLLPEPLRRLLELINVDRILRMEGGFDLWRTRNGIKWCKITARGFGNLLNYGIRTFQSTPFGLFVGTANPFTVGDDKGNPGGAEVWLGNPEGLAEPEDETAVRMEMPDASPPLMPDEFALHQNYPSPCNPETWIPYQLPQSARVRLDIYDLSGQLVRSIDLGYKEAGFYMTQDKAIYWDGRNSQGEEVASGIYFYQIHAGNFVSTRKTAILK